MVECCALDNEKISYKGRGIACRFFAIRPIPDYAGFLGLIKARSKKKLNSLSVRRNPSIYGLKNTQLKLKWRINHKLDMRTPGEHFCGFFCLAGRPATSFYSSIPFVYIHAGECLVYICKTVSFIKYISVKERWPNGTSPHRRLRRLSGQ